MAAGETGELPFGRAPARTSAPASTPAPRTPHDVLRDVFGYDTFRPLQAEIIDELLAGRSAFVLMPTGGGKSLCYQIPSMLRPGLGLVVSPLIALMTDQVAALRQSGVAAARLDSNILPQERSCSPLPVAPCRSPSYLHRLALAQVQ